MKISLKLITASAQKTRENGGEATRFKRGERLDCQDSAAKQSHKAQLVTDKTTPIFYQPIGWHSLIRITGYFTEYSTGLPAITGLHRKFKVKSCGANHDESKLREIHPCKPLGCCGAIWNRVPAFRRHD
jgi:hypothetical protein